MKHYAISDVRFISHGISLPEKPQTNEIIQITEINTATVFYYAVCGYFRSTHCFQVELTPLFTNLKTIN